MLVLIESCHPAPDMRALHINPATQSLSINFSVCIDSPCQYFWYIKGVLKFMKGAGVQVIAQQKWSPFSLTLRYFFEVRSAHSFLQHSHPIPKHTVPRALSIYVEQILWNMKMLSKNWEEAAFGKTLVSPTWQEMTAGGGGWGGEKETKRIVDTCRSPASFALLCSASISLTVCDLNPSSASWATTKTQRKNKICSRRLQVGLVCRTLKYYCSYNKASVVHL